MEIFGSEKAPQQGETNTAYTVLDSSSRLIWGGGGGRYSLSITPPMSFVVARLSEPCHWCAMHVAKTCNSEEGPVSAL